VWFYDVHADGFSLDDKRNQVEANDLPDVLTRWQNLAKPGNQTELDRSRAEQSFCVPANEIRVQGYDLSLNRYKDVVYDDVEHRAPLDIIADIEELNAEIANGVAAVKRSLA
jgi:type I restriction enzyme M protein